MARPAVTKGEENTQIDSLLREIVGEERVMNDMRFAPIVHAHPEFKRLEQAIADLILKMQPQDLSKYALKDHQHPATLTPLKNVEQGQKLQELVKRDLCDKQHLHPLLESSIATLQQVVSDMKKQMEFFAFREDVTLLRRELCPLNHLHPNLDKSIQELKDSTAATKNRVEDKADKAQLQLLREEFEKFQQQVLSKLYSLQKDIPVLPKDEPEIIAASFCLIPQRCEGKRLKSQRAVSLEGKPVEVKVKFGQKEVSIGDSFSAGDLLTLPPNCLVLFRFE